MIVRIYWLSSLLFIASTIALVSSSSTTHHISTSTTKKTTTTISSTHHTSSSSTKSSTATPTSTPSTFYLIAADTGQTAYDGSYFKCILDPSPYFGTADDRIIRFGKKTPKDASNFTINADGTFQCNSASGPLYASVSNGHPYTQKLIFLEPAKLNDYGLVPVTCAISGRVLTCQWYNLVDFYYEPSDVVNGTQVGEYVDLGDPSETTSAPITIKVVHT